MFLGGLELPQSPPPPPLGIPLTPREGTSLGSLRLVPSGSLRVRGQEKGQQQIFGAGGGLTPPPPPLGVPREETPSGSLRLVPSRQRVRIGGGSGVISILSKWIRRRARKKEKNFFRGGLNPPPAPLPPLGGREGPFGALLSSALLPSV
jgi:hypothetical protein